MKSLAALILAAAVLSGTPVEDDFLKGETLDFTLQWLRISGGVGRMTIGPANDDATKLRITSVARSTSGISRIVKFRDEIETIVLRDNFSTVEYHKRLDERGVKKNEQTLIEDGVATRTKGSKTKQVKVPTPVLDPMSVIYYLRTVNLAPGQTHELTLIADGKIYTVHAIVIRRENIVTPLGSFKTIVVEPRMESGGVQREETMTIWYSDDDRRLPVRIRTEVKFGAITATLAKVTAGAGSAEPLMPKQ